MPLPPETVVLDKITKADFEAFEDVRKSDVVNMHDNRVQSLADITPDVHASILKHYKELKAKWPGVWGDR